MTDPKEPTLTCSEVVERPRYWIGGREVSREEWHKGFASMRTVDNLIADIKACFGAGHDRTPGIEKCVVSVDEKRLSAILHSWQERRVQELEEALRITSASIAKEMNRFDYEELDGSGAVITAEEVYKQSLEKAREQIRKGAKHE